MHMYLPAINVGNFIHDKDHYIFSTRVMLSSHSLSLYFIYKAK